MDDVKAVYEALLDAQNRGEAVALATITHVTGSIPRHAGSKMLVRADGTIVGTIGGGSMEQRIIQDALAALRDGQPRTPSYTLNNLEDGDPGICGGTATFFVEPVLTTPTLVVIGGGHVGKAVAELGKWMQWRVILSDDRPEYCNADYLPGMDEYLVCAPSEVAERVRITPHTYIAAVTRGLPVDLKLIPSLLQTDAAYIGLIGSRRRWALTVKALREDAGLTTEQLSRVRAPIGLELQAETPKEIALSIFAEIVMLRRGGTGQPMQWLGEVVDAEA